MPRHVDLQLDARLKELPPETHKELANRMGISEATLRTYKENRWTVLDRTVLERLADFFQCEAGSLLRTSESRFFEPFKNLCGTETVPGSPTCLYVTRPDANTIHGGRPVAYRDLEAAKHLGPLLRDSIDEIAELEVSAPTRQQFDEHLSQNCIVLGSPMVNPAAEMAICRAFGVDPFAPGNGERLPFAFKMAGSEHMTSSILQPPSDGKAGIWLREEEALIGVDRWPREEFKRVRIKRGRDCGVIIVLNHSAAGATGCPRKLIVLGGFSGVGTEAAAIALADHYRDLEPLDGVGPVWGIIQVYYHKGANSMERKDLTYKWRCRVGGRCPLPFVNRD